MKNRGKRKVEVNKDEMSEDWCFHCKDGGDLRICDYKECLKSYHPGCVGKDESFLDSEVHWDCPRHSCFLCRRPSYFHCYTCQYAVCRLCIHSTDFLLYKGTNGFCSECLEMVVLIEEGKDYDPDGNWVDFTDRETCEGLFKEYYDIIKKEEKFKLQKIYEAQGREKMKKHHETKSSSDEYSEDDEEQISDYDCLEPEMKRRKMHAEMKSERRKSAKITNVKSKNMEFVGWGSEPLIEFLTSIGKSTDEKLSQSEVTSIVLKYVRENNFFHPKQGNTVVCDARLRSLLKTETFRIHRVYDLLEGHFLENQDESEEDELQDDLEKPTNSGTVEASGSKKKLYSEKKVREKKIKNDEPRTVFAAIVAENIRLVYLKRSLLRELLKEPESLEEKVIGCFVRVKSDPKDGFSRNHYHLRQIKAVKTVTVDGNKTETVFQFSATPAETPISQIQDCNFKEEECEELREKMEAGLLKRPTLVEFQKKAELLHRDITKHWISTKPLMLQRQIDFFNEKGRRDELFECLEMRKKLQTPSEVSRLLDTLPTVIPDISEPESNSRDLNNDMKRDGICPKSIDRRNSAAPGDGWQKKRTLEEKTCLGNASAPENRRTNAETCGPRKPQHPNSDFKHKNALIGGPSEEKNKIPGASCSGKQSLTRSREMHLKQTPKTSQKVYVFELSSEDESSEEGNVSSVPKTNNKESREWCILCPNGEKIRCCSAMLKLWNDTSPIASKFKVFREDQNEESAISVQEAIKIAFPKR